ncbi:FAD-dependent 5-carboxymethylaminomethyl-2-thiouridine(34) oxidoreductase MnmC1 [Ignatzschineria sp. LJL83]
MSGSEQSWLGMPRMVLNSSAYEAVELDYDLIVVGAGIAGAMVAFRFAEAGYKIAVLEREAKVAEAGSGNLQGMMYLKLSPNTLEQNELLIAGFQETLNILKLLTDRNLLVKGEDWDDCGLIQLSKSEKHQDKQFELAKMYPQDLLYYVYQAEASRIAGATLSSGGLFFPKSGWVSPPKLVNALLSHPNITVKCQHEVTSVINQQLTDTTPLWKVKTSHNRYHSKLIVLAMADRVRQLDQCKTFPFTVVRGQTTTAIADCELLTVVSGEGYIAPARKDQGVMKTTFGATFHRHKLGGLPTDSEHIENIEMLRTSSAELVARLGLTALQDPSVLGSLEGRAATRASAMGSIPIVGPLAHRELFLERFKALRLDAKASVMALVPWELGLYLSTAHGSRGMITASIAAEIIWQYVHASFSEETLKAPYSQGLLSALHPNRFYYRELRFNQ